MIYIKSSGPIKDRANELASFINHNSNNLLLLDQKEISKFNDLTISLSLPIECVILESYLEYLGAEKSSKNGEFEYQVGQSQHFYSDSSSDDMGNDDERIM